MSLARFCCMIRWRGICAALFAAACMASASSARAAGGAHVIDDSEVETPGHCHLETWVTYHTRSTGSAVANPACTLAALPSVELGAGSVYSWEPGTDATVFAPAVKWNLRPSSSGLGLAIDASVGWSSATDRIETASLIVPVTVPLNGQFTANLNAGILWSRTGSTTEAFVGGQILWQRRKNLSFMAEVFEHTNGEPYACGHGRLLMR
ncbi:hypothetical protein BH09PSE3_BH09PSE3_28720 [soil metagenome]